MPEGTLRILMVADLVAIHLGLALVVGALASQAWMWFRTSDWAGRVAVQAVQARQAGFVLALVGSCAAVWFEAAAMSESPLLAAGPALGSLLAQTHYGHAAIVGLVAWLAAGGVLLMRRTDVAGPGAFIVGLLGVAVFVVTRSVVSHAGSQGDLTLDVVADAVHLALVCLWVGIVIAGARLVIPDRSAAALDRADAARWVSSMSSTATVAIVAIGATGLFKVWRGWTTVGSIGNYVDSAYGGALLAKLALVGVAAALGGGNRFVVLPGLFRSLDAAAAHDDGRWRRRLLWILRVEAATLLVVLAAAAVLSSSELPGTT